MIDHAAAVEAAAHLHDEPWFLDRTRDSVEHFRESLAAELAPGENLSLAAAVLVEKSGTHPGLLAVVPASRFVLCWTEGPQTFRESYTLQSVPAETTTAAVEGVDGEANLLVLADRRIVLPSPTAAEQLRVAFNQTAPAVPSSDGEGAAADAPTQLLASTGGARSTTETMPMPPVPPGPPGQQGPAPDQSARPAPSGPVAGPARATGGGGSGRRAVVIVAAALVAVLVLGAAAFGIYRVTQSAGTRGVTGGTTPVATPGATGPSSPETSKDPAPPGQTTNTLPQSREPLPDDTMIVRRNDGDDWRIETLSADGSSGAVLATGQQNRAVALSRDRRSVLFLRVAGDTTTLRAVAADGSNGRGLFSDGTSACPRLAQPAVNAENVLAVVCSGVLKLLDLDGKVIRVLDRGRIGDPTFTADGSAVVYWRARGSDGDGGALYRVPVDGSARPSQIVSAEDGPIDDPVCSPAGDLVAASLLVDGNRQIVTVAWTGDGSDLRVLTPPGTPATGPSWSPDGSQIAYRIGTGNDSGLALMTNGGRALGEILPTQPYLATPVWAPH